jgi:predicted Rossmann fold nucleotide-binding protein DprA/Smf involved in DNA uptake
MNLITVAAKVAGTLAKQLAERVVTVVSGLAKGTTGQLMKRRLKRGPNGRRRRDGNPEDVPGRIASWPIGIVMQGGAILSQFLPASPPLRRTCARARAHSHTRQRGVER